MIKCLTPRIHKGHQCVLLICSDEITLHKLFIIHAWTHTHTVSGLIRSRSVSPTSPVLVNWSRQTQFLLIWPHVFPRNARPFDRGTLYSQRRKKVLENSGLHLKKAGNHLKRCEETSFVCGFRRKSKNVLSHFWITGKFTNHIVVAKLYEVWYFWFIMMKNIQMISFVNLAKIRSHTTEMSEIYWGKQPCSPPPDYFFIRR